MMINHKRRGFVQVMRTRQEVEDQATRMRGMVSDMAKWGIGLAWLWSNAPLMKKFGVF
jgi:hypothetical protein